MNQSFKNILSFLLRFGLSGALLWWLFKKIDWEKTIEVLKTADLAPVALSAAVFFAIYVVLVLRWFAFIRALDLKVPFGEALKYFCIGLFGNLFLPSSIGGDAIKIYGLCKDNATQKAKVVASVLLDRLSGYAGLVLTASAAFAVGYKYVNDLSLLAMIAGLGCVWVGVMAVLFNKKLYEFFCQVLNSFPKAKQAVMQMHYDIALLHGRKNVLWQTVALSCLAQVLYAYVFYLLAQALHQEMKMVYFLIFVPLICVAASFPSIGGLGIREMGAAYLFGKVGMASGIAVSISLVNFLFMIIVGLLGGLYYVITVSSGRVQHLEPDPKLGAAKP